MSRGMPKPDESTSTYASMSSAPAALTSSPPTVAPAGVPGGIGSSTISGIFQCSIIPADSHAAASPGTTSSRKTRAYDEPSAA